MSSSCLKDTHPKLALLWDYSKNLKKIEDISFGSTYLAYWACPVASDHKWQERPTD